MTLEALLDVVNEEKKEVDAIEEKKEEERKYHRNYYKKNKKRLKKHKETIEAEKQKGNNDITKIPSSHRPYSRAFTENQINKIKQSLENHSFFSTFQYKGLAKNIKQDCVTSQTDSEPTLSTFSASEKNNAWHTFYATSPIEPRKTETTVEPLEQIKITNLLN